MHKLSQDTLHAQGSYAIHLVHLGLNVLEIHDSQTSRTEVITSLWLWNFSNIPEEVMFTIFIRLRLREFALREA